MTKFGLNIVATYYLTVDSETSTSQNGKFINRARLNNDIVYGR